MKIDFSIKSVARISLILGVILLILSSFNIRLVEPSFQVFLLSLGILFSRPDEKLYQEEKKTILNYIFSLNFIIVSLIIGTSLSFYLIIRGLKEIPWNTLYYFSQRFISRIRLEPSIECVIGLIMSSTFLAIILFDPVNRDRINTLIEVVDRVLDSEVT